MTEWPIDCVLIGEGSLLQRCGDVLRAAGARLARVVTDDEANARWARGLDVPCGRFADTDPRTLGARSVDAVFSIGNLRVLSADWLAVARVRTVNFHDGPLPELKGLYVTSWALVGGAREHGVTWHDAVAAIDGGAVLEDARFAIAADETALTLNVKCYDAGLAAFERLVDAWRSGTLQPRPQPDRPSRLCRRHDRPSAAGFVDPAAGLEAADRLVRALDFGPYENPLCTPWAWIDGARRPMTRALLDDIRDGRGPALGAPSAEVLTRIGTRHSAWAVREPHWRDALRTLEPIEIPLSRTTGAGRHELRFELDDAATQTPTRVAAAVLVWLSRVSDRTVFDVGCRLSALDAAVAGLEPWFEPLPPCRVDLSASTAFATAVSQVAARLEAHDARGTYLADLVSRDPALAKSVSTPLWTSSVAVVHADADLGPHDRATALTVAATSRGQVVLSFDAATVAPDVVDAYTRSCRAFLRAGAATPDAALVDLPLVDDDDRRRFALLNDTAAAFGGAPTIVGQFQAQAAATPDATAVVDAAQTLTYRELDRRATAVAHGLVGHGVRRGDVVGLHLERSADLVAAVLGVLKTGAAYLPVDPAYPADRTAFVIDDAAARLVVTSATLASRLPASATPHVTLDALVDAGTRTAGACEGPSAGDLAYMIYTSGSTGRPKGVLLEHRHVVSFFAAMDPCVERRDAGVWLAVTSLSFDISVLELLWTVCRGFAVVVHDGRPAAAAAAAAVTAPAAAIDLSLFYFSADETAEPADRYRLLLEGARFADAHGFEAVWTPERHFHAFGGLYPNPAVTSAAIAASTSRIKIRAGSLVLPLHHPVRAAEDWALVDNLSRGRVGVAFASGWHPNDFVLAPHNYGRAKQAMFEGLDLMRRLWRGEKVAFTTPAGEEIVIGTLPRPVQAELPYWVTTAGNPETFRQAGEIGANVLTHLLGQTVEEVRAKIAAYREARRAAGHPGPGHVTLMLHTFVGESDDEVRAIVRGPMKRYLGTSLNLVQKHAWSFPAFKGRTAAPGADTSALFDQLSPEDLDALLEHAFDRYFETGGLFGSVETCAATIEQLRGMGVDEVACLVDFGVPTDAVLASLPRLAQVRERAVHPVAPASAVVTVAEALARYGVTHLQCTPSLAAMLVDDPAAAPGLRRLQHWLVGGEALSETLAAKIRAATSGRVTNMYGPTETTVWSMTYEVRGGETSVPIGTPIANTRVHVLDSAGVEVPAGVPGELYIGGPGVARGYHARPELTAERFVAGRVRGAGRLYRTGDRVRLGGDGLVEFLGRIDHQVKIRGHRIELGEIEAALRAVPGVAEAVAVVRDGAAGDARLVGYVTASAGAAADDLVEPCRRAARAWLPDVMVPAVVVLDALPRTPNGKIDRRRLPAPTSHTSAVASLAPAPIADPWQQRVAEIWATVLGAPAVGLDDNFFDLGGHSLLTVQVAARLGEVVGRPVPVTDLFRFPTVRGLAAHLGGEPALAGAASAARPAAGVQAGQARAAARRAALQRR